MTPNGRHTAILGTILALQIAIGAGLAIAVTKPQVVVERVVTVPATPTQAILSGTATPSATPTIAPVYRGYRGATATPVIGK